MSKKYWKEIALLLIVKSVLLTGLWYFSFRDPPQLDDEAVANHLLR